MLQYGGKRPVEIPEENGPERPSPIKPGQARGIGLFPCFIPYLKFLYN